MTSGSPADPFLDNLLADLNRIGEEADRAQRARIDAMASPGAVRNLSGAEVNAALEETEERDAQEEAKSAVFDARATLDGDREARRKRKHADERADRRAAEKARAPKPYAALAGREMLMAGRVNTEAKARRMQLMHAAAAKGCSQFLVKTRGSQIDIVRAWATRERLRIDTKDEPKPKDIAAKMPSLDRLAGDEDRVRQLRRLLAYADRLETSGVWKPFDLLADGEQIKSPKRA
ncbi:hypothetical protein [Methylopila sp. Yamaguchi]|uniref:hypothetical protein n=1 Tax=Methylopila sp. Yamaguchi TaxID=1437817 RepID=UPI000CB80A49|nr:hypothetical protein [Methylopila sp. Yamaguchi]GBD48544.1 hypothetical protein METY_1757 [Methylopila sp. Yamaguchi]